MSSRKAVRWIRGDHSPPATLWHNRRRTKHSDALPGGAWPGGRFYLRWLHHTRWQAETVSRPLPPKARGVRLCPGAERFYYVTSAAPIISH
jgi:hypothetical protein